MSGGSLDYFYNDLEDHVGDFGDKELDDLVKDLAELFHDREWFLSGDTCEGSWREARDEFKHKWFSEGARQERVEHYLKDIHDEVMDMFGFETNLCINCKHWKKAPGIDTKYGSCDLNTTYMMHRSDKCDKGCFEERGVNGYE